MRVKEKGGSWIGIEAPSGPSRCKTESIKITMIAAEGGGRGRAATTTVSDFFRSFKCLSLKTNMGKATTTNDKRQSPLQVKWAGRRGWAGGREEGRMA